MLLIILIILEVSIMSNTDKKGQTFNHDTIEAMNETKDIKNKEFVEMKISRIDIY